MKVAQGIYRDSGDNLYLVIGQSCIDGANRVLETGIVVFHPLSGVRGRQWTHISIEDFPGKFVFVEEWPIINILSGMMMVLPGVTLNGQHYPPGTVVVEELFLQSERVIFKLHDIYGNEIERPILAIRHQLHMLGL